LGRSNVRDVRWALIAVVALVGCAASDADTPPRPDFYVLTAANELIGATSAGRVVVRRQFAQARRATSPGPRLALDGGRLVALVRRDEPPDRLVVVDVATAEVLRAQPLPADFHARVVVARLGRVFVAGNRIARLITRDLAEEDAVVLVLDDHGRLLRRFTVREAEGHDWWVAAAALSPDRRRLTISYHGGCTGETRELCTTGADVVDVATGSRATCVEPHSSSGCISAHGQVDFVDGGLIVATGSPELRLLGADGRTAAVVDTKLGNSHVMDFHIDRGRRELLAAGPCQHFGGLSAVTLPRGPVRLIAPPTGGRVCGHRVTVSRDVVVVAPIETASADPSSGGRVLLVSRRNGRVRASVRLGAEPVDVLAIR
jgi:hypothetical protein